MKKEQIFMILPKRFISPSGTELGSFCLLDKCVSHYTMEPLSVKYSEYYIQEMRTTSQYCFFDFKTKKVTDNALISFDMTYTEKWEPGFRIFHHCKIR